jgi:hypothetical protein
MAVGLGNNLVERVEFDIIINVLNFHILPFINEFGVQSYWTPGWGSIIFENPSIKRVT